MDVRLARPTDAAVVLALTLDERAHLIQSPSAPGVWPVFGSLGRSAVPVVSKGRTWIARERSSVAVLVAHPRRYVMGWDIAWLAGRGSTEPVGAVIEAAIEHVQRKGVPRLFARCGTEVEENLRSFGFRPLSRELTLRGRGTSGNEEVLPDDSRYRMPQDAWPLHQLESEVTPPFVRQLEGLSSLDWSQKRKTTSEIVIERDGKTVAWIAWGRKIGPTAQRIGMLVHPDHADLAPILVRHVQEQAGPDTTLIARIRDYHVESITALRDAGFETVREDVLMVRHGALVPAKARPRLRVAHAPSINAFPFIEASVCAGDGPASREKDNAT